MELRILKDLEREIAELHILKRLGELTADTLQLTQGNTAESPARYIRGNQSKG